MRVTQKLKKRMTNFGLKFIKNFRKKWKIILIICMIGSVFIILQSIKIKPRSDFPPTTIMDEKYVVARYQHTVAQNLVVYQKKDKVTLYAHNQSYLGKGNKEKYTITIPQKITKKNIQVRWRGFMGNFVPENSNEVGFVYVKISIGKKVYFEGEHAYLGNGISFKDGMKPRRETDKIFEEQNKRYEQRLKEEQEHIRNSKK